MKFIFLVFFSFRMIVLTAQVSGISTSIVPEIDFYYLENWKLNGNIHNVIIHTNKLRNPALRFQVLDECRNSAKTAEKYISQEDRFDFNRKGRLMKRTQASSNGKFITLFSYNFFNKIESIESGEKSIFFRYDLEGNLLAIENFRGAKMDTQSLIRHNSDTTYTITNYLDTGASDSIIEVRNKSNLVIYKAIKIPSHPLKEDFMEYNDDGLITKYWNNLGGYFEYEYNKEHKVVKTYVGRDKSLLLQTDYDFGTGICTVSHYELVDGAYLQRNYECRCEIIDGQNNPVRLETIDCSKSDQGDLFSVKEIFEIEYEYFK